MAVDIPVGLDLLVSDRADLLENPRQILLGKSAHRVELHAQRLMRPRLQGEGGQRQRGKSCGRGLEKASTSDHHATHHTQSRRFSGGTESFAWLASIGSQKVNCAPLPGRL